MVLSLSVGREAALTLRENKEKGVTMAEEQGLSRDDGTYFIDAENAAEMARLINQDRLFTRNMGSLFPPSLELNNIHDILDISCGPGSWALDVTRNYPDKRVTGIDISQLMVAFAGYQAREQKLSNAHFVVMDALKPLDFPDNAFDFVNARFISGFMPKAHWPTLVQECLRILRPGGLIRLTEFESTISTSYAVDRLSAALAQAMHKAGQTFSPTGWQIAMTPLLERFLRDAGYQHIGQMAHALLSSFGTEGHLSQYQNLMVAMKLGQPYLVKWGAVTAEEAESLYQRALAEMKAPDYSAVLYFLSVWGEKPG
jgi:ubiquinone/menaquinone biosynthesis C-methylase UbiE